MDVKRHICILCKSKKTSKKMFKVRSHWTCLDCISATDTIPHDRRSFGTGLRILNLYAGIGGNRKHWTGANITAIEYNVHVAKAYQQLYPNDTVIVGDAHNYLLKHYNEFDVIWSSPPCQTHSRMNHWTPKDKKRYVDLSLYQQIIFLRAFFRGKFIVEKDRKSVV